MIFIGLAVNLVNYSPLRYLQLIYYRYALSLSLFLCLAALVFQALYFLPSFAHDAGLDIPLEHDGSSRGESGDRAAAARHIEQLHDRLHDRILHRKLHVHTDCLQSAPETGLSPVPHVHTVRPDRGHVLDRLLDQAGSHPGEGHPRRDVTIDPW